MLRLLLLFIDHLFVDGTDELVLLQEVLAHVIDLLTELAGHLKDYGLIQLVISLREGSLLLLAVDLHDVIDNVEIVVDRVASRKNVLG